MTKAATAHNMILGLIHPETTYTITSPGTTTLSTGDVANVAASITGGVETILSTGLTTVTGSTGGDVRGDSLALGASTVSGSDMTVRLGDGDTVSAGAGIYNMTMFGSVGDSVAGVFHAGSVVNLGGGVDTVTLQHGSIGTTINGNDVAGGYNNTITLQAIGVTINLADIGSMIVSVDGGADTFNLNAGGGVDVTTLTVQDFSTVAGGTFNYDPSLTTEQVDTVGGSTVVDLSNGAGNEHDFVTFQGDVYSASTIEPFFHST